MDDEDRKKLNRKRRRKRNKYRKKERVLHQAEEKLIVRKGFLRLTKPEDVKVQLYLDAAIKKVRKKQGRLESIINRNGKS